MTEQYRNGHAKPDPNRDDGADRETRPKLCTKRPLCYELAGHEGGCKEKMRDPETQPTDFGPTRKR